MDEQAQFQAILDELNRRAALDPQLRQIMKKIEQGKADFSDTAQLSERASNLLGEVFGANVADIPAEVREAVCTALLKDRYDSMNGTLAAVQEALDEPLGLHLTPQKAPFPSERVEQLAHSLVDPTVKPETIRRRANQPVATVAKSFHDDYIKTNARFRNRLGLKPTIKRFGVGCCQWCAEVAGTYRFGEQPEDVFRRHDNCGCVIIYDTQVLRGARTADGGSSRAWTEVDPSDLQANPPTSLSQEEAQELERFARQRLTFAGERGIINYAKPIEMLNYSAIPASEKITPQGIVEELGKSNIGNEILQVIETLPEPIKFTYGEYSSRLRGEENAGSITIYLNNCKNIVWAARSIIHECTHYRYGIGQSQWAECVCVAQEIKHARNRDVLTQDELRTIVKAVKTAYPELQWKRGGVINGRRKQ